MPEINEKLLKLNYENLKGRGIVSTDYNTFRSDIGDVNKAREIHNAISAKTIAAPFDKWYQSYGFDANQPTAVKTQPTTQDPSKGVVEVQLPELDTVQSAQPVIDTPIPAAQQPVQQRNQWVESGLMDQLKKEYADSVAIKARNLAQPIAEFDYNSTLTPEEAIGILPVNRSMKPSMDWKLPTMQESQDIVDKDFYDRVRGIAYEASVGGDMDVSDKLIEQAQSINPNDPYLHRLKAFNLKSRQDYPNALKSIDTAIQLSDKEQSVNPSLYLDKAGIELESGNSISAYANADKYIKSIGGVSDNESGLKDLAEAYRIKAVVGKNLDLDKVPAGNGVKGSKYDIDLFNYKSALSQSKAKTKERQDQEISATLKTMPDYLMSSPYNGFSLLMSGFQGASEAINKIQQSVEGEREVFNEIAPGITKREVEELSAGTRAVMFIGGMWGLGMAAGTYAMPGSLGKRKMISQLMIPELALFNAQAGLANMVAPEISETILAPVTAARTAMGMDAPNSELGKESLVVGDMVGFMLILHGAKAVSQNVGNAKAVKDIAQKVDKLYTKIAERKPLTEEEYTEVSEMVQDVPPEAAEIYNTEIKPEIKTITEQELKVESERELTEDEKKIISALEKLKLEQKETPKAEITPKTETPETPVAPKSEQGIEAAPEPTISKTETVTPVNIESVEIKSKTNETTNPKATEPIQTAAETTTQSTETGQPTETELSKAEVVKEINSKPLSHVSGLVMGAGEAEGTYLSTEKGNRYSKSDKQSDVQQASVSVENPYVIDAKSGEGKSLIDLQNEALPLAIESFIKDNPNINKEEARSFASFDQAYENYPDLEPYVAKQVTKGLKEQGYDSIYHREVDSQEGMLIVFDKNKVTIHEKPNIVFTSSNGKYEIEKKGSSLTVRGKHGKEIPSRVKGKDGKNKENSEYRTVINEYIDSIDLDKGETVENKGLLSSGMNELDAMKEVASGSDNPREVAIGYERASAIPANHSAKEDAIRKHIGHISKESWIKEGDKNKLTRGIRFTYIRKGGEGIEQVAQRASLDMEGVEGGELVTTEDVVNFIKDYEYLQQYDTKMSPLMKDLNNRFIDLTGISLTNGRINKRLFSKEIDGKRLKPNDQKQGDKMPDVLADEINKYGISKELLDDYYDELHKVLTEEEYNALQKSFYETETGERNEVPEMGSAATDEAPSLTAKQQASIDKIQRDYEATKAELKAALASAKKRRSQKEAELDNRSGIFGDTKDTGGNKDLQSDFEYNKETKKKALQSFDNEIGAIQKQIDTNESSLQSKIDKVKQQTEIDWSEKAISALENLKVDTKDKLFDATLGIPVAAWNTAIDIVIAGVKAGKAIEVGIKEAIDYIKAKHPDADESEITKKIKGVTDMFMPEQPKKVIEPVKETLPPAKPKEPVSDTGIPDGMKERGGARSVLDNPDIRPELKEILMNNDKARFYVPREIEVSKAEATAIIQARGLESTIKMMEDNPRDPSIHPITRTLLRSESINEANRLFIESYGKKSEATRYYSELADRAIQTYTQKGTEIAQELRAMGEFTIPERELFKAQLAAKEQRNKKVKDNEGSIKTKKKGLDDANAEAIDGVLKDKDVSSKVGKVVGKTPQKPAEPKTFKTLVEKERAYRKDLLKGFKKSDLFLATAGGFSPKAIELVGNLTASYVREGAFRTAEIAVLLAKQFKKEFGVDIDPKDFEKHIPDKIEGKDWGQIETDGLKKQADKETEDAANTLAQRIVRRLSSKPKAYDPVRDMINTLFGKVDEKLEPQKGAETKPTIETIGEAIANKEQYKEVWEASKAEVESRIDNMEISDDVKADMKDQLQGYYDEIIGKPYSERQVGKAVKEAMKSMDETINDIIRKHYSEVDATRRSLTEKLIEEAGVSGEDARLLTQSVASAFERLTLRAKQNALRKSLTTKERIFESPKKIKATHEAMIELSNMGAFDDAEFTRMYAEKMGLPEITPEQAIEIKRLAQRVHDAPQGEPKNRAITDLLNYQAKLPGIDWGDVGTGFWYANMLSGISTQQKNVFGNMSNHLLALTEEAIQNPSAIPFLIYSMSTGYGRGAMKFRDVMKTGYAPIRGKSVEVGNVLEQWEFDGKYNPANAAKYVPRIMFGADAMNYEAGKDLRAFSLAKRIAAQNGIKFFNSKDGTFFNNKAVWQEVDRILNRTPEAYKEAEKIALEEAEVSIKELPSNMTSKQRTRAEKWMRTTGAKIRAYELLEMGRDKSIIDDTNDFAAKLTYNHNTEGNAGLLSDAVSYLANAMRLRVPIPFTGKTISVRPGKFIVPFTRIVTNVMTRSADFFPPVALYRGIKGGVGWESLENTRFGGKYVKYTPEERSKAFIRAGVGLAASTALYLMTQEDEKGESAIQITANGTRDWQKNKQLEAEGWKPYSIKAGGIWWSYQYTPLLLLLAPIGILRDGEKYDPDFNKETTLRKIMLANEQNIKTFGDMSFVSNVANLMNALTSPTKGQFERYMQKMAGTGKSFVLPNIVTQTSQYTQKVFDMPRKEADDFFAKMIMDIPIARNSLSDMVNVLGDPVYADPNFMFGKEKISPEAKFLNENNLFIAKPKRESEGLMLINDKTKTYEPMTDDEYYKFCKLRGQKIKSMVQMLMEMDKNTITPISNLAAEGMDIKLDTQKKIAAEYRTKALNNVKENIVNLANEQAKWELFKERTGVKAGFNRDIQSIINESENE